VGLISGQGGSGPGPGGMKRASGGPRVTGR
jgi:hypothetical protein